MGNKRTFEEALNIEFKKFVFIFMDVVEKNGVVGKKIQFNCLEAFKDFSVPKIILTVAMTLAMF
jgi:hypothetical protein